MKSLFSLNSFVTVQFYVTAVASLMITCFSCFVFLHRIMGSLASHLSDISTGLEMLDFYTGITGMSPQCEKKRGGGRIILSPLKKYNTD